MPTNFQMIGFFEFLRFGTFPTYTMYANFDLSTQHTERNRIFKKETQKRELFV